MFHLYRSSRLERLADLLAAKLHGSRPYSVLSPQSIVVGHLGMKRWLTQRLAEISLGPLPRIAANLDMLLPSEWIDRLSSEVLGESNSATAQLRRDALRWRIFDVLGEQIDSGIVQYLQGADSARRRFQLADRLSGLYNQYLVYRSDWLCCWEGGSTRNVPDSVVDHWQGELWRRVVDTEVGHRGRRMGALVATLPSLESDPEQPALHVFGLSHLPPDVLEALDRVSANRDVHLYFPDPCRELWEELHRRRDVYSTQLEGGEFLILSHPLLASLGRMGQHHCLQLASLDPFEDERDVADESLLPFQASAGPLLSRLQNSIRMLQPDLIASDRRAADPRADASLRVHLCHTRLRELEVLKDALLDRLANVSDLHPRQIVVMAPNMAAYAPLLSAVFGEPGRSGTTLPYHLADVSLRRTHPLLTAFAKLLDLPMERITRSQVLTLLGLPAVMRRFGLDESKFAGLERWIERSHVAWGLDGPMKADFGATEIDANSFAFGFDRMAAGFLVGNEDPNWLLGDVLPAHPVIGPDAQALGALWAVLELLGEWREHSRQALPLSVWAERLQGWIERLFQ
ncbi:MAG: exodeoxyribonuclease V subunit gamma, partial [Xanthomonadales bacterium]|nr:exodeoxyribonuclease V subunit gamma [Xanthomonadales bacterium]